MKYETVIMRTPSTTIKVISDKPSKKISEKSLTREERENTDDEQYFLHCTPCTMGSDATSLDKVEISKEVADFLKCHNVKFTFKRGNLIISKWKKTSDEEEDDREDEDNESCCDDCDYNDEGGDR